jgi:hypothetical protein
VQTALDAEHALIVAHKITDTAGDNSLLLPMAEAAREALGHPESLHVVADAGYSNGEQAEPATSRLASSARRRLPTHAAASDPGNDAPATIDGGASLCLAEVPHLRTSALPAARTKRSADRDQPGDDGLQPETYAERVGWKLASSVGVLTTAFVLTRIRNAKSDVRKSRTSLV